MSAGLELAGTAASRGYPLALPPVRPSLVALASAHQLIRRRDRRRRMMNIAATTAVLAAAVAWMFTLRPQALGGPAGYVMIRGVSMNPVYRTGDLVIVRPGADYAVGDIVAYRVPKGEPGEGIIVIHRIVGGSASSGFTIRGDNTSAADEWYPKETDIVGKAWLRVPRLALILAYLDSPLPLASLAAGIAISMVLAPKGKGSGRGASGRPAIQSRQSGKRKKRRLRWGTSTPGSSTS